MDEAVGPVGVEFPAFDKVPRLNRDIVVTEKVDGTNVLVFVTMEGEVFAGGKSGWLSLDDPGHYGWSAWVKAHAVELRDLGPGAHRGEWWGQGIQKRHGKHAKTFSLFNVGRWAKDAATASTFDAQKAHVLAREAAERERREPPPALPPMRPPACCDVVPVLYRGRFSEAAIRGCLEALRAKGSVADPGNLRPEGIVVFHVAAGQLFKATLEKDDVPKSLAGDAGGR